MGLIPVVFELDLVHYGFALNLGTSAKFSIKIFTTDGKIRTKDDFFVPRSLSIFTFGSINPVKLANVSRFVPSVLRIHFGAFGMTSADIAKVKQVVLDFSTSKNPIGTIVFTGVRFAFV